MGDLAYGNVSQVQHEGAGLLRRAAMPYANAIVLKYCLVRQSYCGAKMAES
jgi:hypothetical protein